MLDDAKVSWKIYATKVLDAGFWEPFEAIKYVRYGPDWSTNIIAPQTQVLNDAANGHLAAVSWVTPSKEDSDHPAAVSDKGPSWVASIVNAVGESSYWPTSAIIVVWDDWGGFYDNAPPPQLDYRGLGIRVPCLIISPYAKHGYVSHVQYEYGSILRFIEEVYGLLSGSIGSALARLHRQTRQEPQRRIRLSSKAAQILADSFEISTLVVPPRAAVERTRRYGVGRSCVTLERPRPLRISGPSHAVGVCAGVFLLAELQRDDVNR